MELFKMYFLLGLGHITDWVGYDHILFIAILCALYSVQQWKPILVLITAFTLGHSASLILSVLNILSFSSKIIEFLIPVTIFLTALSNIFQRNHRIDVRLRWIKYFFTFFFGLIHGFGFSLYLKSLLGGESNLILPLFSFNSGIEIGQICIVGVLLLAMLLVKNLFRFSEKSILLIISVPGLIIALWLMVERFPWK